MQFSENDKILIYNLVDLKGYNGKHLVREFTSKGLNVGLVYQLLQKLYGVQGGLAVVLAGADDAAPTQLITLILFDELVLHKNGQARNNVCTLLLSTRNYQYWFISVKDIASLPVILCSTLKPIKARLDKFWSHQAVKFDFTADLTGIRNQS